MSSSSSVSTSVKKNVNFIEYMSLLNHKCITKSSTIIEYPLGLLDIFTDNICMDQMNCPVILNDSPIEIYDRDNIFHWFLSSNKDPITGRELRGRVKFSTITNMFVAMSLLEKKENKLLFHVPDIDLINLFMLVQYTMRPNYEKVKNDSKYLGLAPDISLDPAVILLDIDEYYFKKDILSEHDSYTQYEELKGTEKKNNNKKTSGPKPVIILGNCKGVPADYGKTRRMFSGHYNFTLQDVLLNDVISGKPLVNPKLSFANIILDGSSLQKLGHTTHSTISNWVNCQNPEALIDCKIIINKIADIFKQYGVNWIYEDKSNKITMYGDSYFSFYNVFAQKSALHCRADDFYISSASTEERMYSVYIELINSDLASKYKNYEQKRKYLSDTIRVDHNYLLKAHYGTSTLRLDMYRSQIEFPVIGDLGIYSDDFSLLDLDHIEFKSESGCHLKGREFIGTNFSSTVFTNISFMVCSFVASDLSYCKFVDCEFKECSFYKAKMNTTDFINCTIDTMTILRLKNEFGNRFRHFKNVENSISHTIL